MINKHSLDGVKDAVFEKCAKEIGCEVACLRAVTEVECGGRGCFFAEGKPAILFEGHVFWRNLIDPEKYVVGNEDILYPTWTKDYYKGGLGEYDRLERAKKIDETAALKSASWGAMQVLGENYKACGCSTVQEFVEKMSESGESQLELATKFILHHPKMAQALRDKDWETFARLYNGKGYKKNHYDEKLAAAYIKHKDF